MGMKMKVRVGLYCCCMFFFGLAFAALPPLIERISGNVGVSLAVFSGLLFAPNYTLILVLALLFGLGSGGIFSTLLICLNRVIVPGGKQIGFILGVNAAGIMLFPMLSGWLLDHSGYAAFMLCTCAALLIAYVLQMPITRSRKTMENL